MLDIFNLFMRIKYNIQCIRIYTLNSYFAHKIIFAIKKCSR